MPPVPIAPPRWNAVAFFGLVSILGACGDNGTGPPDGPPDDDSAAFLVESLALGIFHTCGLNPEGEGLLLGLERIRPAG